MVTAKVYATFLVLLIAGAQDVATQAPARLSVQVPKNASVNEPLIVEIALANSLRDPIRADLGWFHIGAFELELRKPDGTKQTAHPASEDPEGGIAPLDVVEIPSGADFRQWIVLNQWVQLPTAGIYDLTIRFSGVVQTASRTDIMVEIGRASCKERV